MSFCSHLFNTSRLKLSTYCIDFLALFFALESFSHFFWDAEKPVIFLTDNNEFFSVKIKSPVTGILWRVVTSNIVLAHIPGRANAAADFLSRMQTDPSHSLELQLLDSIRMKQIDIDLKARTPDASMLLIVSGSTLIETEEPQDLMAQLQANNALQKFNS